jgi:hypothetical protein
MKSKSRDWDLTLELSCHAGFPTVLGTCSDRVVFSVFRFIDSFYRIYICITMLQLVPCVLLPCTLCSNKDCQDVYVCLLNKVSLHQHNIQIHDRSISWLGTGTSIHDHSISWLGTGTSIHDHSISWLGTGASIKSGGVKLVL